MRPSTHDLKVSRRHRDGDTKPSDTAWRRREMSRDGVAGVAIALVFLVGFWLADRLLTAGRRTR